MTFSPFTIDADEGNAGARWKKWLDKFENFLLVCNIEEDKRKKAMFLHYIGDEAYEIFESFTDEEKGISTKPENSGTAETTSEASEYATVRDSFTKYFTPRKNLAYEVFKFRQMVQDPDESMSSYYTRLKSVAANCEFVSKEREITSQIIQGCKSSRLRRKALKDDLKLQDLIDEAKSIELAEHRASEIEKNSQTVNRLRKSTRVYSPASGRDQPQQRRAQQDAHHRGQPHQHRAQQDSHHGQPHQRRDQQDSYHGQPHQRRAQLDCHYCGYSLTHAQCPARGKECTFCHKIGHFARVCKSKLKVRQLYADDTDDDDAEDFDVSTDLESDLSSSESVFIINTQKAKPPLTKAKILNTEINFLIDTGASVNIVSGKTFKTFEIKPKLKPPHSLIFSYCSNKPLKVRGYFETEIHFNDIYTNARFYVIDSDETYAKDLLGLDTSQSLGMIQFAFSSSSTSSTMPSSSSTMPSSSSTFPSSTSTMPKSRISDFPSLFDGKMGKIKDMKIKLHIDKEIQPITQRHRRIPFHIRKDVEKELERLENLDVIERIDGPTPWISPIVTVPKKTGGVRICVDMREANKAIKREKHPMPTIDDLISDLNDSKIFSKLDLSNAYHQLELDEDSRYITTFTTHVGLFRYKRLIFGVNAAAEIFQKTIADLLHDIKGAQNLSDDIIVHGRNQTEHDQALKKVLKRLDESGAKLNKDKCKFSNNKLTFFGHIFSNKGISADPEKMKIIGNCPSPTSAHEVRSFLGMAQYVARYVPHFATITEPLRQLTKQKEKWKWTELEQRAFDKIKSLITSSKVMAYFNPKKETKVLVDASSAGLGAILMQEDKVICYASRALTPTEQRYSQTDKEMLAVVYGVEHFHLYLFGSSFTIITDHKPLIGILQNQKPATARMERWRLRLMPYQMNLIYKPGKNENNPADYISRHPQTQPRRENAAEEYIAYVASHTIPKAMTKEEVKIATEEDPKLQCLLKAILSGDWRDTKLNEYRRFQDEISAHDGLLLRDHRLIIPEKLQKKVINIAHQSHQGIVKTKQFIREKVWFPNIDILVEETIKSCIPCQASQNQKNDRDPIIPTPLPDEPWQSVSMDFLGPFPTGDYLMVIIDDYSRYPEVEILSNISARTVLPKMENIFARQGIPEKIKTDNGPPFNGKDFHNFAQQYGFKHRKVTPLWPEANGEVERFMKTLNKFIRIQNINNRNWKSELPTFLRHYRSTAHTSTKVSPFKALTGREMNSGLPKSFSLSSPSTSLKNFIFQEDRKSKENMIDYANKKRKTKPHSLNVGDSVLVKQKKINKFSSPFNPNPLTITKIKGSMITAKSNQNESITRNSSNFKRIRSKSNPRHNNEDNSDSLLDLPFSRSEPHSKSNNNNDSKSRSNQSSRKDSSTNRSIHFPLIPDLSSETTRSTPPRDNQYQQPSETPASTSDSGRPVRQKKTPQYLQDYQT